MIIPMQVYRRQVRYRGVRRMGSLGQVLKVNDRARAQEISAQETSMWLYIADAHLFNSGP